MLAREFVERAEGESPSLPAIVDTPQPEAQQYVRLKRPASAWRVKAKAHTGAGGLLQATRGKKSAEAARVCSDSPHQTTSLGEEQPA